MFAMLAAELDTAAVREIFLDPLFKLEDSHCFDFLAPFVQRFVCNSVMDAPDMAPNAVEIMQLCLDRVLQDSVFNRNSYRAGQLHGWELPLLCQSLLFVLVEHAPLASRFANGDWREIAGFLQKTMPRCKPVRI